jgi:DNA-binding GntR family transcriptional regulator
VIVAIEAVDAAVPEGYDRRSSADQVSRYIRSLIFAGDLPPGERLRQDDIANALGVSRIPVREAMIALDREGWVRIEPHRGVYVAGLDANSIRDYYEMLGMLYGLAGRRAAERASDADLSELAPLVRAIKTAGTPQEVLLQSEQLGRLVFRLADSHRLRSIRRVMTGIVPGNFFEEIDGAAKNQQAAVGSIVRAIRNREGERVAREWAALLRRQGEAVIQLLEGRNVIAKK